MEETAKHPKHDELEALLDDCRKDESDLVLLVATYAHSVADRWDIASYYHERVREVAEIWSDGSNVAAGIKQLTSVLFYFYSTQFDKVGPTADEAIEIFEQNEEPELLGVSCMIRGVTLRSQGQFDDAISFLTRAAKLISRTGLFKVYNAFSNYQIAEIFVQLDDLELAEVHYLDADDIAQSTTDETAKFRMTNGLGNFYLVTEQWEKAEEYLSRSLSMAVAPSQRSRALCDLGIYNYKLAKYDLAIEQLTESHEIRKENNFEDASSTSLIHLGKAFFLNGDIEKAKECGIEAHEITLKFNAKQKQLMCLELLGDVFEKLEDWEAATKHLREHQLLQSDLNTQQMRNIYKTKNKMIQEQKEQIEEAHQEIKDSIAYAKRIQTAILPPTGMMNDHLKDHFVLYKPKDVVAGDFYWLEPGIGTEFFAAADCTGHGVPGAMVSVVCNNALNRSVREFGLSIPGKILDKTREIVIEEFEKSEEEVKDGMDICLCALRGSMLQFAGAHNALWLIRKGELIEYKGDKQPVGKFMAATEFTTHNIELQTGDTFYILTDGFVDQFGGDKGKKFKPKNLKSLLLSIQDKPIEDHKQILDETFEKWKGELEQVDDVCVIGVRI